MAASTLTTTFLAKFSHSTLFLQSSSISKHDVIPNFFTKTTNKSILVQASKPQNSHSDNAFISKEDVSYLVKLGAGSVAGAAAIKYGSIVFPEITKPNIVQALTMISAPVIVAVLLLIKQSSSK
ncbi:hypothetical protein LIER_03336 [Lithospermum erythrorhizon]|uniref:Uncharacterized protein n=1 Tax=Lithospermum erythrorhizon TaxID=34254 RepID=A0AAV3NSS8_LITER